MLTPKNLRSREPSLHKHSLEEMDDSIVLVPSHNCAEPEPSEKAGIADSAVLIPSEGGYDTSPSSACPNPVPMHAPTLTPKDQDDASSIPPWLSRGMPVPMPFVPASAESEKIPIQESPNVPATAAHVETETKRADADEGANEETGSPSFPVPLHVSPLAEMITNPDAKNPEIEEPEPTPQ